MAWHNFPPFPFRRRRFRERGKENVGKGSERGRIFFRIAPLFWGPAKRPTLPGENENRGNVSNFILSETRIGVKFNISFQLLHTPSFPCGRARFNCPRIRIFVLEMWENNSMLPSSGGVWKTTKDQIHLLLFLFLLGPLIERKKPSEWHVLKDALNSEYFTKKRPFLFLFQTAFLPGGKILNYVINVGKEFKVQNETTLMTFGNIFLHQVFLTAKLCIFFYLA